MFQRMFFACNGTSCGTERSGFSSRWFALSCIVVVLAHSGQGELYSNWKRVVLCQIVSHLLDVMQWFLLVVCSVCSDCSLLFGLARLCYGGENRSLFVFFGGGGGGGILKEKSGFAEELYFNIHGVELFKLVLNELLFRYARTYEALTLTNHSAVSL